MNKIIFTADLLAIPFFYIMFNYFHNKNNRTITENILYLFSITGLIVDIFFTLYFIKKKYLL